MRRCSYMTTVPVTVGSFDQLPRFTMLVALGIDLNGADRRQPGVELRAWST